MRPLRAAAALALPLATIAGCSSNDDKTAGTTAAPSTVSSSSTSPTSTTTSSTATATTSSPSPTTSRPAPSTSTSTTPTTSAAATSNGTQVRSCYTDPTTRPSSILIACGDGGEGVSGIRWTSWGPQSASGTGTHFERVCDPNCAEGHDATTPVTVRLSNPVSTSSGTLFSVMTVTGQRVHTVQLVTAG